MKKNLTAKRGDTFTIRLPESDQYAPHYRAMTLVIEFLPNGTINLNTHISNTALIEVAHAGMFGVTVLPQHHND